MNEEELNRMRNYATAAREHPTWSVAYAQDVPKLLDELGRQRERADGLSKGQSLMQDDLADLLRALEMGDHARPQSPHEVMQSAIAEASVLRLYWHRLRFAEMVLDRNAVTFDGLPWREAARLREAADGVDEPETGAKADA